ncbi:cupin domain-containing protein [Paenibacillus chungangensis]|uniref:Cupin domain-containing protein n=1 Tax=Paenibacillus chungangensis TaxID=696535 RepID=A0ABW3HUH2_9BACL
MNHDCYSHHHVKQQNIPGNLYNWYDHGWHYPWNLYYNWNAQSQRHDWNPYYRQLELRDYGPYPLVINIEEAAKQNNTYRTALWTGGHLQVTLMSINKGEDIGLEVHPHTDQFIRIEEGQAFVQMGDSKDRLDFTAEVGDDDAIMIPAGKWHNVTNTGHEPLKIYVIYAPPEHPFGTVHETKAIAMAAE